MNTSSGLLRRRAAVLALSLAFAVPGQAGLVVYQFGGVIDAEAGVGEQRFSGTLQFDNHWADGLPEHPGCWRWPQLRRRGRADREPPWGGRDDAAMSMVLPQPLSPQGRPAPFPTPPLLNPE